MLHHIQDLTDLSLPLSLHHPMSTARFEKEPVLMPARQLELKNHYRMDQRKRRMFRWLFGNSNDDVDDMYQHSI